MKCRLSRIGNRQGMIIEKPSLELLKVDENTALDITTDGEALIIRPCTCHVLRAIADLIDGVKIRI